MDFLIYLVFDKLEKIRWIDIIKICLFVENCFEFVLLWMIYIFQTYI